MRGWPALVLPVIVGAWAKLGLPVWSTVFVGVGFGLIAAAALIRSMDGRDRGLSALGLGSGEIRLAVSTLLIVLLLAFVFVMTLLVVTLVVIGIMAGSGFDFDAAGADPEAFSALFSQYRVTPGWQLSQAVFLLGAAAWLLVVARAIAFAAASIVEERVVAMEAVKWSRGMGLKLLAVLIGLVIPPLAGMSATLSLAGTGIWPGWAVGAVLGAWAGCMLLMACALSLVAYRALAPVADGDGAAVSAGADAHAGA